MKKYQPTTMQIIERISYQATKNKILWRLLNISISLKSVLIKTKIWNRIDLDKLFNFKVGVSGRIIEYAFAYRALPVRGGADTRHGKLW
jgi:hypothetical protein